MLEFITTLTQADGTARTIVIRIGDVRETHKGTANPWSAAVEIVGFAHPEMTRLRGRDWAEAIEDAAKFAAARVTDKVESAGGGTLNPLLLPRPSSPSSNGMACRISDDEVEE